jgi:hypothetical protein
MGRPHREWLVRITVCKILLFDTPVGWDLKRADCSTWSFRTLTAWSVPFRLLYQFFFCKRFSLNGTWGFDDGKYENVFWEMTPCILVGGYQCFGSTRYIFLVPWMEAASLSETGSVTFRGVTSCKAVIFIFVWLCKKTNTSLNTHIRSEPWLLEVTWKPLSSKCRFCKLKNANT